MSRYEKMGGSNKALVTICLCYPVCLKLRRGAFDRHASRCRDLRLHPRAKARAKSRRVQGNGPDA
jgi:hypothetical protein